MASTTDEQSSNSSGGSGYQGSEFVILLGEDAAQEEAQTAAKQPAAKTETDLTKNAGEFVILLGEKENAKSNTPTSTDDKTGDRVLRLGKDSTISGVAELHKTMLELVKDNDPITIDASRIEHLDTAGTQLLCSFVRETNRQHIEVLWQQPSEVFMKISSRLDLLKNLNTESIVQR